MKLRGAGWLVGTAVIITAFGTIAACDDSDPAQSGINIDGGNVNVDAGGVDGNTQADTGATDSGQDANKPETSLPAQCNDGKVDQGETCDPLDKCPTDCPPDKCNIRTLENGGTCAAVCTTVTVQTQCQNGDGCCPDSAGCSISNDSDCQAVCGNGIKEAGEECDGPDCPTACPAIGCQQRTLQGTLCTRKCVDTTKITTCSAGNDQCCPAGGACAGTDPDCGANACGNGTVEGTETCDVNIEAGKPGACPTKCSNQQCKIFSLSGTQCTTECKDTGTTIKQCINNDGCCDPTVCNSTNDNDCQPVCGNGVKEANEKCDGDCPTECKNNGCALYKLTGKPDDCTAECVANGTQTTCANSDQCCPNVAGAACTYANDNDCPQPSCGNGKLDTGETCDNSVKGSECLPCGKTSVCRGSTGSADTCDLVCNVPTTSCPIAADACCPYGCNSKDGDCTSKWLSITLDPAQFPKNIALKEQACVLVTIDGIVAGGFYDVTTCSEKPQATGDVAITSVVQIADIKFGTSVAYGKNDNCDEKDHTALPYLAKYTCENVEGKTTMACVSEATGGFKASNALPLQVTICGISTSENVPFTVFYNARSTPKISSIEAAK